MKLTFLTGDINFKQYGAKWITKKFNNGEFDYWLVVELINMLDATSEKEFEKNRYNISISAVSPSQVSEKDMLSAIESCGWDKVQYEKTKNIDELDKVLILSDYGIAAHLYNESGNNFKTLWHNVHDELIKVNMLFGFYMDKTENRLGTNGWDFIKGDIMRPLREYKEMIEP